MKKTILIILVTFFVGCKKQPETNKFRGKEMPSVDLLLSDSLTHLNSGDIPVGKMSVIFLFSPYCDHCRNQMKDILKNIGTMKDVQFYVITFPPFNDMIAFNNHFQIQKYPNVTLAMDNTFALFRYFELKGVPFTAVYDKSKRLIGSISGEASADAVFDIIVSE